MTFPLSWSVWLLKMKPTVAARIRRLNRYPKQGQRIRGYHPKPMSWRSAKKLLQSGHMPHCEFRTPEGYIRDPFYHGPVWDSLLESWGVRPRNAEGA